MKTIAQLLAHGRHPGDLATIALAGVIGTALRANRRPLILGLSETRFQKMLNEHFVAVALDNGEIRPSGANEFDDLVHLLLEHRAERDEPGAWIAYAVASAAMGESHLWEDMGLPSRQHLSDLLRKHFPALAIKNEGGAMKWKKFFYRQLCERAEVPICKSPHCADCCDYAICFDPES